MIKFDMVKDYPIRKTSKIKILFKIFSLWVLALVFNDQIKFYKEISSSPTISSFYLTWEEQVVQAFIKEFEFEAQKRGVILPNKKITFAIKEDLGPYFDFNEESDIEVLGTCWRWYNHVAILKRSIVPGNFANVRSTVFHELAHCYFHLDHDEEQTGFPNIMEAQSNKNWDEYILNHGITSWNLALDYLFLQIKKHQS